MTDRCEDCPLYPSDCGQTIPPICKGDKMKLDEAIKNLSELGEYGRNKGWDNWGDAIKLGIKALERCKHLATLHGFENIRPLLGETK